MELREIMQSEPDDQEYVFAVDTDVMNLSTPDPHDGSPANIDPETQKEQEEVGRLEVPDDDDFETNERDESREDK